MPIANAVNAQTEGIQGMTSAGVWDGTPVTNHAVLVGGATASTLTNVGPSATAGQVLQSGGASADPSYSTATYPATAGTSGNVLTSNGTNWVSSAPAAGGDVVGPASSTDNALARFDSTTGKLIQDGVVTEDDTGNISQSAAVAGGSLSTITSNTSNTASATALHEVQVAGSTASDAYFKADISGGQNWTWGLDNSDSDAFALSSNATLGTTNVMRVATTGEINYPLQSAFLATTNLQSNVTGNGTVYTVVFANEIFDQNSDFDGTSTFTAPVTGRYQFNVTIDLTELGAANTSGNITLVTSNRSHQLFFGNWANLRNSVNAARVGGSVLTDMDAGDTATVTVTIPGGALIVDVQANAMFSGYLVC